MKNLSWSFHRSFTPTSEIGDVRQTKPHSKTNSVSKLFGGIVMKRILLASLSVLALSTMIAPIASAEPQAEQRVAITTKTLTQVQGSSISPRGLVSLALRGAFRDQGIPSSPNPLSHAYLTGRVTAANLVQAAIGANQLSPEVLSNSGYLHMVNSWLADLNKS
jgi:hypothetical protein